MVIHGWTIYFHACFEIQLNRLLVEAQAAAARRPQDFRRSNAFKRFGAVSKLAFDQIPRNPADSKYRQGDTLGKDQKHWFRAKFFQQYRLFFRYSETSKVIIYAWVNDDNSLRAYGAKNDAYTTFARMLQSGEPPSTWDELFNAAIADDDQENLVDQINALQGDRNG